MSDGPQMPLGAPETGDGAPGWLSTADVADARRWSRTTAWRWLRKVRATHGAGVVRARGRSLEIERSAFVRLAKSERQPIDPRVRAELDELRHRLDLAERALAAHAKALARLRAI